MSESPDGVGDGSPSGLLSPLSPSSSPLGGGGAPPLSPSAAPASSSGALVLQGHASDLLPEATRWDESLVRPLQLALGEELLLPFVEEYAKLQQALLKSHESETRFVNKCKALSKQTRAHTHKLTALHAIHLQDAKRKQLLAADIDKHRALLQRLSDEMKEKKEGVNELRGELALLGARFEESSSEFLRNQRAAIGKLEMEVAKYTLIRDKDRGALTKIRSKNVELFRALQDLLAACSRSQQEFDGLEAKLLEAKALSGKELRRKAELERQMKEVQQRVAERQQQLAAKKELIAKAGKEGQDVELQLQRSEKVVEAHRAQYEELNDAARQANEQLLDIQESNDALSANLKRLLREVEEDRQATRAAKGGAEAKLKALHAMRDRVRQLGEEVRAEEDDKLSSQHRLRSLKDQIAHVQFKLNSNAKAMDTCVREREVLAQNHMAMVDQIKAKEAALKIKHSTLKNIKNEHQGYLISIRALTKILEDLKRDKMAHEQDLTRRIAQKTRALEEVAQRELQISEYQSQILVNEAKLRQQQNLLEAVRSDRNMYRKTLIEQQTEMHEYKRKFHFLSTQVRQSKSEIEDKNQLIVFEHFNLQNVRDDIGALESQNGLTHQSLDKADALLRTQAAQIRKLSAIIADADEELRVQVKQYNSVVNEQRVLNQQLVKRNDELAALYEQLKLQNSILTKSAAHYKDKQLLLAEYSQEYARVSSTLSQVLGDISKFVELKDTISSLESALVAEQLKVKALQDELRKPINIHRWRRLMDTNTDSYGMLKRVRTLQSELIAKTDLVAERDKSIQEKEKLYVDLRRVLARQPGSEAAEQLRVYLEQLDEKRAKLKAMKSELRLYQAKCKEHQFELQRVDQEMQLLKLEYFRRRKAMQRKHAGGQGGGGGGGNGTGGDGAGSGGELDDMPDILRPTEFPDFPPPPGLLSSAHGEDGAGYNSMRYGDDPTSSPSSATAASASASRFVSEPNPYLASASASGSASGSAAASARQQAQHQPRRPGSGGFVRGLDEDDEDEADDAAARAAQRLAAADEDSSGAEEDDAERAHSRAAQRDFEQKEAAAVSAQARSSRPSSALRASSRQSVGRPDSASRSIAPGGGSVAPLQAGVLASAAAAASQRSDSRSSQRGSNAGNLSQRGEAGFSRFPSIGGGAQ